MKKIKNIVMILLLLLLLTSCFGKEKAANNSVNTKIISVTDFTLNDFEDTLVIATEKACSSMVALVDSRVLTASLGSAVIINRIALNGNIEVADDSEVITGYKYYAITNYHVIKEKGVQSLIKVYLKDDTSEVGFQSSDVTVVEYDESLDMAILSFTSNVYLEIVKVKDSKDLKKGQFVIAVGTPLGLENFNTVTQGIIGHPYRKNVLDNNYYIQHDATINPGNSGGGLFNIEGKLIGINTSRLIDETQDVYGIGFAIPTSVIISKYGSYIRFIVE